ncbi:MAG: hypothetical protein AAFX94_09325, partial [Myxococcota bacterium]
DHPVVRQYSQPHSQLYFRGACSDPAAAFAGLWQVHREATHDYVPFDRYLNTLEPLPILLSGGHGQLADGPAWLVTEYGRVLEKFGLSNKRLPERPFKRWEVGHFVEASEELSALILGSSYIVAQQFEVQVA